ncbi:MAG: nucleotide exchange factor GrpE, partial [Gemmatimonadota bacterium]
MREKKKSARPDTADHESDTHVNGDGQEPVPGAGPDGSLDDVAREASVASDSEDTPAVAEAEEELERLRRDMEALNDRHLRLAAEFDNYRKRHERERVEHRVRSQAELVAGLLEVLDDLERVEEYDTATATVQSFVEGVRLVERKLRTLLETAGLEVVDVEDQPFDPATMDAMMTVPTSEPDEDDLVADVFQKGYRFK